jgi:trimeric autotransporter adhesin
MEVQNVQPDKTGHYTLTLGSTNKEGLPASLFASGEARWLGVQPQGQAEQPRVLLLSVPYALKAADAETVGGLPASAFMLAAPAGNVNSPAGSANNSPAATTLTPAAASNVTTSGGTVNAIPLFTTGTNIQNSLLTQTGTTIVNVGGKLILPATSAATSAGGKNSRAQDFVASSFNSSSSAAVPQTFQLQAEPAANNTVTPSGNLSLLFGSGTTAPTETGFRISGKGILTFATGQTFPGTGKGTITGVTAGTGLTGGGTTGTVTLNLDATKIPVLQSNNTFTGTEKFNGNVGVGAVPSATGYTPLTLGGATNFGTWLALANSSAGGHTWNIISAGSGNAEGAGNIGITDLTGKSTIWLEGNTNTGNLNATGVATAASINADPLNKNAGGPTPGIIFGAGSGEGIASNRTIGLTKFGLDFYTEFAARMSILQNGQVAIGTASPAAQLGIVGNSNSYSALLAQGADAPAGSGQDGAAGMTAFGGSGDGNGEGLPGITASGGGGSLGGAGGTFIGGGSTSNSIDGGDGIDATSSDPGADFVPAAGFFDGNVIVDGGVSSNSALLKIDHPLDPANKYLSHSAVESSDMMNIYNGVAVLDASGEAVIQMPEWFGSLNRDFRYQLTCIGGFAPVFVAEELANNRFKIGGGRGGMKISWQITGVRQDAWANAHRTPVEQMKSDRERGFYLSPEAFGAPAEKSISWARNPRMMRRAKELRQKRAAAIAKVTPGAAR